MGSHEGQASGEPKKETGAGTADRGAATNVDAVRLSPAISTLRCSISKLETVMDLTAVFSDDQLAVIGCFGALLSCGLIAAITFHFGPAGRQSRDTEIRTAGQILPAVANSQPSNERKAA